MSRSTWGLEVFSADDTLAVSGRASVGRSRNGNDRPIALELSERWVYWQQKFLEACLEEAGPWMEKRAIALQLETLRLAVACARRRQVEETDLRRMLAKREASGVADSL